MWAIKLIKLFPNFKGKGRIFQFFKNIYLKKGEPIVTTQGKLGTFAVDLRSFEWEYFCNGTYDENEISLILSKINFDEIFIDVGANIGFYSVAIAKKIKENNGKGKVIAFEPHPGNFQRLKNNVELNALSEYVDMHMTGLSDQEGILNLVLREDFKAGSKTGNASIAINDDYDEGFKTVEIKTQIFDNFLELTEIDLKIGFIKLDIEGHEDSFLRGAQTTIRNHSPKIVVEVNKPYYVAKGGGLDACLEIEKLLPNYHFRNIASGSGSTSTNLDSNKASKIKASKKLSEVAINEINNVYCYIS